MRWFRASFIGSRWTNEQLSTAPTISIRRQLARSCQLAWPYKGLRKRDTTAEMACLVRYLPIRVREGRTVVCMSRTVYVDAFERRSKSRQVRARRSRQARCALTWYERRLESKRERGGIESERPIARSRVSRWRLKRQVTSRAPAPFVSFSTPRRAHHNLMSCGVRYR